MFRLTRYVILTCLTVSLMIVLLAGLLYRQLALNNLIHVQQQQHIALVRLLCETNQGELALIVAQAESGRDPALSDPAISRLKQTINMQMIEMGLLQFALYNREGQLVLTGNDQMPLDAPELAARLTQSFNGTASSDFISTTGIQPDRLISVVPLQDAQGELYGAAVLVSDVSPYIEQISNNIRRVLGGMGLVLVSLVIVAVVVMRRANKMLAEQMERHQQAENQLRRQALTFANINDSVVITDIDGTISDCNPATEQIFGYTREEVIGGQLDLWYRPLQLESLRDTIIETVAQEHRWSGEIPFIHKDGTNGVCEVVVVNLNDEQDQPIGRIWVGHDITMRKYAEKEMRNAKLAAEAANQAKSLFLANMSHELRTPLTAIIGYSDLMIRELRHVDHPTIMPDLMRIQASSRHLLRLVNDILDLSRIEAGRMSLYLETVSVHDLIKRVVEDVRPQVEQNRNILHIDCATNVGEVYVDSAKLYQIVFNLLDNAAKFTTEGEITLTVAREVANGVDWLRIGVSDTGIGITREQMQNLFQPFMQGDNSATRKHGGAGLGLSVSQRFCEMMGGRISVASEPGIGSIFVVYVPAVVINSASEAVYMREVGE